jgi:ribosomal protein S18 acetylase RimI-like enzyme
VDPGARARAIEFLSTIEVACAERIVVFPGGRAILDSRHPRLWSANQLRVEDGARPDAEALIAAADEHLGALDFRMIAAREEAVAMALGDALVTVGYEPNHDLLMIFEPPEASAATGASITEIAGEQLAHSRVEAAVERCRDAEVGRQLASRDKLIASVIAARSFAVLEHGEVAARCQLYADRDIAQVENVYTRPSDRRRGLARALVGHAVQEARASGARLIFLIADASDWPQGLYREVGFRDAGLLYRFKREVDSVRRITEPH